MRLTQTVTIDAGLGPFRDRVELLVGEGSS